MDRIMPERNESPFEKETIRKSNLYDDILSSIYKGYSSISIPCNGISVKNRDCRIGLNTLFIIYSFATSFNRSSMKNIYLTFLLISTFVYNSMAQSCSVNAGIGGKWCMGEYIELDGGVSGSLEVGQTIEWSLVSGPGSVEIDKVNHARTIAKATVAGLYTFRISVNCDQGTASQEVTHEILPGANADAGPDQTYGCYDGTVGIPLIGFNTPPSGYIAYWTINMGFGYVEDNVFKTDTSSFMNCGPQGGDIILTYTMTNGKGCSSSDTKIIHIDEVVPKLKLVMRGGCGVPVSVTASCQGKGVGTWSWVSPVDGGGASFANETSQSVTFKDLIPNTIYTIQYTLTNSCFDQVKTLTFTSPESSKGVTKAVCPNLEKRYKNVKYTAEAGYVGVATLFFCDAPDTIILEGSLPNKAEMEVSSWQLNDLLCDFWSGSPESYPRMIHISDNAIMLTGFSVGIYVIEYQITNDAGCTSKYKVVIEIESSGQQFTYYMSNNCEDPNYSRYNLGCRGNNEGIIWSNQFLHFVVPSSVIPISEASTKYILKEGKYKPVSAPSGGEKFEAVGDMCGNFSEHWFEYYLNIDKRSPSGTYIFQIPIIFGQNESPCGEGFATLILDVSQPPAEANAGTDQYICGTTTRLVGNDVAACEWRLVSKSPTTAVNPKLSGINTRLLDIQEMSMDAEYIFVYYSLGGTSCGSKYDTVKVGTTVSAPLQPDAGNDITICYGSSIVLDATPAQVPYGALGTWTIENQSPMGITPVFSDIHNPQSILHNLQANTTYTLRFTLWNNCGSKSDDVTITTSDTEGPSPAFAGNDQCIASGVTTTTLRASEIFPKEATGQWSAFPDNPVGCTIVNASNNITTIEGLTSGTYRFVWTVTKTPCMNTRDTVTITVGNKAEVASEIISLCNQVLPTTIFLNATPAQGGQWVWVSGTGSQPQMPTSANTMVTQVNEGYYVYRWIVNNDACSGFKDVHIKVGGATPEASAGSDIALCGNDEGIFQLKANSVPGTIGVWTVEDFKPNVPSAEVAFINGTKITDANAIVQMSPGAARLRWTIYSEGLCNEFPSFDDVILTYVPKVQFAEDTITLCNAKMVNLTGVYPGEAGIGQWTKVSGAEVETLPKFQLSENPLTINLIGGTGTYVFNYKITSKGCQASDANLTVINSPIPNWPVLVNDTFCTKDAIFLKGGDIPLGYTNTWTYISGPTAAGQGVFYPNNHSQNAEFGPVFNGVYEFSYSITNGGCSLEGFVVDSVRVSDVNAGRDITACDITGATLPRAEDGKVWKAESGNPSNATVDPITGQVQGMTVPGDYFFRLEDIAGCFDIVMVTRLSAPTILADLPPQTLACKDADLYIGIHVQGSSPIDYQWSVSNSPNGIFSNIDINKDSIKVMTSLMGDQYFKVVIQSGSGCNDTSLIAKVTVLPQPYFTVQPDDVAVCQGDLVTLSCQGAGSQTFLSYQWQVSNFVNGPWNDVFDGMSTTIHPVIPHGTTLYYRVVVGIDGVGCTDDISNPVKATVNTLPIIDLKDSISTCNSSDDVKNSTIDFESLVMQGDATFLSWNSIDMIEPPGSWNQKDFAGMTEGIYRFVATTNNAILPCPNASDTVFVYIRQCCPIICTDAPAESLCNSNHEAFDLNKLHCFNNPSGQWNLIAGPNVTDTIALYDGMFRPLDLMPGEYTISYKMDSIYPGCPISSEEIVKVAKGAFAGSPKGELIECENENLVVDLSELLEGEDANGKWSSNDLPIENLNSKGILNIKGIKSGIYRLSYVVSGGELCGSDTSTVEVKILAVPKLQLDPIYELDCNNPIAEIKPTISGTKLSAFWTTINGQPISVPTSFNQNIDVAGTYILQITDDTNGCSVVDTIEVRVGQAIISDVVGEAFDNICHDDNRGKIVINHIEGGNSPYSFELSGTKSEINQIGVFTDLPAGNYSVKIVESKGCWQEREFVIDNPAPFTIRLEGDSVFNCEQSFVLQVNTDLNPLDVEKIEWYAGSTLLEGHQSLQEDFKETQSSIYTVLIKSKTGCEKEAMKHIRIDNRIPFFAPNVFSPNQDGNNDVFKLYFDQHVTLIHTFRVFDRWGALMCEQNRIDPNDVGFGWAGDFRGQGMTPGTYVWMAEVNGCDGRSVLLKGDISLVR